MICEIKTIQDTSRGEVHRSADQNYSDLSLDSFLLRNSSKDKDTFSPCSLTSSVNTEREALFPFTALAQQWTEHLVLYISNLDRVKPGFCIDD